MPPIDIVQKICLVQKRIANICVGASTVRGQPKRTVDEARKYLKSIKLEEFSTSGDESQFKVLLDNHTGLLKEKFPSKSWGMSRKVLNIFLFQASHDILLNRHYALDGIIPYLELPLDNPNAQRLVKFAKSKNVELEWKNIRSLKPETNEQFQEVAKRCAHDEIQWDRCYLEVCWWRSEE
ncbi:hypothetical protein HYV82_04970 [Candidatus Woesearchaeota archaeon]|nr:hypothetical protein [Candidatus Woesearchaeota archaeon]